MTTPTYQTTPEQQELLDKNPQHYAVSFLDDGDLVICEDAASQTADRQPIGHELWAVWVLTRDGKVHSFEHHYHNYHDWTNETPGRELDGSNWDDGHAVGYEAGYEAAQEDQAERDQQPQDRRIIDANQASQHLLLKYRVNVTPRTVRNWLREGKLAGGQLGDADRSPWYTTYDALDQASTRAWFPDPEPALEPDIILGITPGGQILEGRKVVPSSDDKPQGEANDGLSAHVDSQAGNPGTEQNSADQGPGQGC